MPEPAIELHEVAKQYPGYASKKSRGWGKLRQRESRMDLELEDEDEPDDELGDDLDDEAPPRHAEDVWALRDLSLTIDPGTRLALIGQPGSGKTTLVKLLTRVLLPTEGHIVIRGRVNPLFRTIAGMMSPHETARHNIVQLSRFLRVPESIAIERTDEIAEFAEVGPALEQRVSRLSPGEVQRLGIAVALHLDPDILVADDSIAAGDAEFEERCQALVREKAKVGLTTIFTGRDPESLRALCDHAILLDDGVVVAEGSIDDIGEAMYRLPSSMSPGAPVNPELPPGANGIIESITVASGSDEGLTELGRDQTAEVRVRLSLESKDLVGLRCTMVLTGSGGVLRMTHPTPVILEEPGRYTLVAPLPAGLLVEDTYSANVSVYDHARGQPVRMGKVNRAFTLKVRGVEPGRPRGVTTKSEFERDWDVVRP